MPAEPWLKDLSETTLELHRTSHSMERPHVDEEWLEYPCSILILCSLPKSLKAYTDCPKSSV